MPPTILPPKTSLLLRLLPLMWSLPWLLLACDNNAPQSPRARAPYTPFNHTGQANAFNHNAQENAQNHENANSQTNHQSDTYSPMNRGRYGQKDTSPVGPLRWHLCNCLVTPSNDIVIPRRYYSVCATDPINAETYSYEKCRPLIFPSQNCSSCVCTPTIACSSPGSSL